MKGPFFVFEGMIVLRRVDPMLRFSSRCGMTCSIFWVLLVFSGSMFAGAQDEMSASIKTSVEQAVARVKPALIRIHVVSTEYYDGREQKYESVGSGIIITKEGHAVTNHHVAGHATRMFCTMSDRKEIEADLAGVDPLTDIALIKLRPAEPREFPVAVFGDSSAIAVGDPVLSLGSPRALSQSVTLGIVSNTEMIMPRWMRKWGGLEEDGEDVGALVKWIGHDAEIHGGNSGGPLVNLEGEIVGINEISMGLGGAIPGNLVKVVADQLKEKGKVIRAWLGMNVQPRLKYSKEDRGVLVSGVIAGSPAVAADIRPGDLILQLNGVPIDVRFDEELPDFNRLMADLPIGQPVEVVVLRAGKEITHSVTAVERMKAKLKEHELKEWGITASDISLMAAKEMKRASRDGVLVTSVRPGGGAGGAKPNIMEKDILVEVNGTPVANIEELFTITAKIVEGQGEPVPVPTLFERKTKQYLTVVKVGLKELDDPGLEVKKAWLPAETQVLTRDIVESLDRQDLTGFRVTKVYPKSTAEAAGLKVGDMITAVDGEKLTASAPEDYEELPALIRQYKVGSVAQFSVLRGDQELTIDVQLIRAPKLRREMKQYRDDNFEMTVRDIGFFDKADEQWQEEQAGVLVSEVASGGWAALAELGVGDLILSVDGVKMTGVDVFEKKMKEIGSAKPSEVVFEVLRGIYTFYLEMEPKWDNE